MSRIKLLVLAISITLVSVEIFFICIYAWYKAGMFDGYAANGIFQLLDPLRRLYAGQTFGRDFVFFHGPFTALIHYPLFLIFGHNLYATSMAEWLISPLLIMSIFFVFMRILIPRNLGLQLLGTWILFHWSPRFIPNLIYPSNSVLGVRILGLVLVALALWYAQKLESKRWHGLNLLWDGVVPLLVGFALLNGTEFGLASVAAILIVYFIFQNAKWYIRLLNCGRLLFATIACVIGLAAILSKGAPFTLLSYSFVDVPTDQFWYFGTPPNPFLTSIAQIFSDKTLNWSLLAFIAVAATVAQIHIRRPIQKHKLRAVTFLLLASLLSLIPIFGYYYPAAQAQPMRMFLFLAFMLSLACIPNDWWRTAYRSSINWLQKRSRQMLDRVGLPGVQPVFLIYVALLIIVYSTASGTFSRISAERHRLHQHNANMAKYTTVVSGSHLARWWDKSYKAQVAGTKGLTRNGEIWSMYVGLLDADKGTFNPAGYDYIIHALGSQRRDQYLETFSRIKPESVITLQTTYFRYQPWLENEHWALHRQLFLNYEPATRSDMAVVWRKKTTPWEPVSHQWQNQRQILGPEQLQAVIKLPGGAPKKDYKLYTFEIDYDAVYKLAKVPYIGKMPRFLVAHSGLNAGPAVSLPPYMHSFSFPVVVRGNDKEVVLHFNTYALTPGARLHVKTLKWRQENVSRNVITTMYDDWVNPDIKAPKPVAKR